jgi:phage repressor protein C with HTH and peptisase S24 domain
MYTIEKTKQNIDAAKIKSSRNTQLEIERLKDKIRRIKILKQDAIHRSSTASARNYDTLLKLNETKLKVLEKKLLVLKNIKIIKDPEKEKEKITKGLNDEE